ncbi:cobyrinic acid a,c-diamide synthase [Mycolicibacterium murale]|uniref:Cobyrinic acid a,c-diamide synthase n=2 Tax=Mycolicibacterium murale TaxID=182220 RepID=A0A7I9WF62_9MYCO|nr:cobyrinic acid a,c-diamide synthase [Mycolicibacterium murale]
MPNGPVYQQTDVLIYALPYLLIWTDMPAALIIVVANLKGGSTKTTTAAFVMHALADAGLTVLGVDSDGENESLLGWSEAGEWTIPVIGMPVTDLHRKLPGVIGDRYDAVVIDTPPMKERRGVVASAIRLATHVLVPMAPTGMEYARLPAIRELVEDAAALADGDPAQLAVVLTRTVSNAASTEVYRQMINADGVRVLGPTVGRLERYAQAFGLPITNAAATAYGDIAAELLGVTAE